MGQPVAPTLDRFEGVVNRLETTTTAALSEVTHGLADAVGMMTHLLGRSLRPPQLSSDIPTMAPRQSMATPITQRLGRRAVLDEDADTNMKKAQKLFLLPPQCQAPPPRTRPMPESRFRLPE